MMTFLSKLFGSKNNEALEAQARYERDRFISDEDTIVAAKDIFNKVFAELATKGYEITDSATSLKESHLHRVLESTFNMKGPKGSEKVMLERSVTHLPSDGYFTTKNNQNLDYPLCAHAADYSFNRADVNDLRRRDQIVSMLVQHCEYVYQKLSLCF